MRKQYIALENNQRLAYQVYGNGEHTLLLLHGLVGSSWLGHEWAAAIEDANVRCIALERPGYGESSALLMESIADWIPLIRQAAQSLRLTSADVVGCSAGAPYAYATACALPEIVNKAWILGGVPIVYEASVLRHYSEENQAAYRNFLEQPFSAIQDYYAAQMRAAQERIAQSGESYIKQTIEDILTQHCWGMAQESRLQILPWKLAFSSIQQPIILRHAAADEMVPYAAAKEMPQYFMNCIFSEIDTSDFPSHEGVHSQSIFKAFLELLQGYPILRPNGN